MPDTDKQQSKQQDPDRLWEDAFPLPTHPNFRQCQTCEEAEALGTELEVVGVEFDGDREHHCWTERELFQNTGDF